jgi:hypothetical protein
LRRWSWTISDWLSSGMVSIFYQRTKHQKRKSGKILQCLFSMTGRKMCGDWVANANPCDCCATGNDLNLFFYIFMKILLVSILVML